MIQKIVQKNSPRVQSIFTLCLGIAPTIINKSNNHKNNNDNDNDNNNNNDNNNKTSALLARDSFTLALHLQLVPLCDNFHAFEEALILQRQIFWSFYQRSTYSIELQLWVNQKTLWSFYKFSKFKMKTFGDYLGDSFVLGHVADVGYSHSYIIESLRKPQLQRQRERH